MKPLHDKKDYSYLAHITLNELNVKELFSVDNIFGAPKKMYDYFLTTNFYLAQIEATLTNPLSI